MKQIIGTYSFNAAGKTVTLTDFSTIRLDRLLVIVNVTTGQTLYTFNDSSLKATVATNVVTLNSGLSTSGMNNTDKLEIFYDCLTGDPTYDTQPVSASSLPLPTGAATAAKQPALGTAGSASVDVITVQGIASGTPQPVAGDVAAATTDSGNPVKIGGKYSSTAPTYTDGQRGDIQIGTRGSVKVQLMAVDANTSHAQGADNVDAAAVSATVNKYQLINRNTVFNGTTWDRQYGDATNGTWVNVKQHVALPTGTNVIGKVGIDQTTPGTTNAITGSVNEVSFSTAVVAAVGTTDVNAYRWVSVAIQAQGTSSTVTFQVSNNNSTWFDLGLMKSDNALGSPATNTTITGMYSGPINARYFRLNVTGISAGTTSGVIEFYALPGGLTTVGGQMAINGTQATNVAQINSVAPLMGTGASGTGAQRVVLTNDALSTATVTPAAATTTNATLSSAATTNATSVKATAGNVYSVVASNVGAGTAFLKLYNKASAPTVGTDVPVLTIPIGASGVVTIPFGTEGFRFSTGIAFAITNLVADSDTTAVAAAQVKVMISYI